LDSGFSLTISNLVNPNYARVAVNVNGFTTSAYNTVSSNGVLTFSRASIEAGMGSTNWAAITGVKVYFYGAGDGAGTSTFDVSNFQATPAPGALALLGVAGLVGARRRRD
jgi:MYXO-CTERM domain-containing protein